LRKVSRDSVKLKVISNAQKMNTSLVSAKFGVSSQFPLGNCTFY
jgi:hypothetical protein